MWQVAFSSKSVFRKTRPDRPTRESPSTSATSPSIEAPSSALDLLPDQLGAGARLHVDDAAGLEAKLEVAHDGAGERERHRRADGPFGPAAVGAREDLLGRHVRDEAAPSTVSPTPLIQASPGSGRREVGARSAEAEAVEAALVQLGALDARACRGARARPRPGRPRRGASPWRSPPRAARRRARRTPLWAQPSFG